MTIGHSRQAYRYIRSIEWSLRKLENLVRNIETQTPELRHQDARSELLEQVHVAGAMEQRSISHTWIGSQVAAEYLDMWHTADGRTFYRVTKRAIRELHLGQLATTTTDTSPSNSPFGDDWQSEEDSVYDRL